MLMVLEKKCSQTARMKDCIPVRGNGICCSVSGMYTLADGCTRGEGSIHRTLEGIKVALGAVSSFPEMMEVELTTKHQKYFSAWLNMTVGLGTQQTGNNN